MENPNQKYAIQTEQYDISFDDYTNFEKKFGHFSDDETEYIVTDRNTPRQWLNFMVNDKFASVAANDGAGMTAFNHFSMRVTRFYSATDYLIRKLDGKRTILVRDLKNDITYDLLSDSKDMQFIVKQGTSVYRGSIGNVEFNITIFVPDKDTCEFWIIKIKNNGKNADYELTVGEDIGLMNMTLKDKDASPDADLNIESTAGAVIATSHKQKNFDGVHAFFALDNSNDNIKKYDTESGDGRNFVYTKVMLTKKVHIETSACCTEYVISGANDKREECIRVIDKYKDSNEILRELEFIEKKWKTIVERNSCEIPDKNMQGFLNVWLKKQLYLTMRYNRFDIMGFRDLIQDTWGHLLVNSEDCKKNLVGAISRMYSSGKAPKKFDWSSETVDLHEFMDGPTWIPIAIDGYIKETGDFNILNEAVPYKDNDEITTVKEHILRALDFLYHSRGKNGLILMRRGDWLDGLEGINEYGEATSVWGTMAAFHAQNIMAGLLRKTGDDESAKLLEKRSAEYKRIVNDVAWDGNWFVYAFIDDKPLGSHTEHEGKIYLNPQTWSIFTGIADSEEKIEKIRCSISTYLMTMYGTLMMAPPYTKYGERCGRLQKQRPGTFANSAAYLHAGTFKIFADCKQGRINEALDLFQRILPNHEDNPDSRRTSEPYAVGNVYYGITHPCAGLNLYTWFTATPAWLIHAGYEEILGVSADYDGLRIDKKDIYGWDKYKVVRTFRNTKYIISFERSVEKGIWADGIKQKNNIVFCNKPVCEVSVKY